MSHETSRTARVLAAALAVGIGGSVLTASAAPREVLPPPMPSAEGIATGQYACSMTVEDTHTQFAGQGVHEERDELIVSLTLTPKSPVADYTRLFPNGRNHAGLHWYSPEGTAFVGHKPIKVGGDITPGFPVLSRSGQFHDDASPTGDDLSPSFVVAPKEAQPIGARNNIYLKTQVLEDGPNGELIRHTGYTLCGAVEHTGPMSWKAIDDPAAAPTFLDTKTL